MSESTPILNVSEVVELEQAIATAGTSLLTLMERAGASLAHTVDEYLASTLGEGASGNVVVLAGNGNNGGDGWVAAHLLAGKCHQVTVVTPKSVDAIKAEPAHTAAQATEDAGLASLTVAIDPELEELRSMIEAADVVIDALLGTGFSGDSVREPMSQWIEITNEVRSKRNERSNSNIQKLYVVAADVPSGLSAQTGNAATPCIIADATVTMLVRKPGLLVDSARPYVGTLETSDLGIDVSQLLPLP